jgi:thiol-disulfide isomerase/thioredoxin
MSGIAAVRRHAVGFAFLAVLGFVGPTAVAAESDSLREGPRILVPAEHRVGELVPADMSFTDLDGKPGTLADFRGKPATVLCMTGIGCPIARKYGPVLADLAKAYGERGVQFLLVNPNKAESPDAMREVAGRLGIRYVHDADAKLGSVLGATSSTEVFVLDGGLTLAYRGAIDDQFGLGYALPVAKNRYLADALDAVLGNVPPAVAATTAPGCELDLAPPPPPPAAARVTYHNRVSRILQRSCVECHRDGEAAPFTLDAYEGVTDHLAMIRKTVRKGIMPPWFADPSVGHWANDRSLPERDKADLLAWIEAGAPEGDAKDAPVARAFTPGWRIGQPDAIFETPAPFDVPATGVVGYQRVMVQTKLPEDKWVRAVEIRPTHPGVVHHVLVFVVYPPDHPKLGQQPNVDDGLRGYFAGLVPNSGHHVYPAGTAKLLPRDALLIFQIHYTPNGTAVRDRPRIGFVFDERPPAHELLTLAAANPRLRIPPGDPNHKVTAEYTFGGPARLTSFSPHSHVRGKAYRYELTYPDGRTERVLELPRYDFNWQLEYVLRTPIDVPRGTKMTVTAWYDNSADNPANPDPTKTVRFGDQTWDEMMIGYFSGHKLAQDPAAAPTPERTGRANDE